ncbi:hypothetical protein BH10PSE18_BH10PSE18_08060 [soil metagenome]
MNENLAAGKADVIMIALITNQPGVFSGNTLQNPADAQALAKSLAAFRKQLIADLTTQAV